MPSNYARKLILSRRFWKLCRALPPSAHILGRFRLYHPSGVLTESHRASDPSPLACSSALPLVSCRRFSSPSSDVGSEAQGLGAIDYSSILQEDEYNKLADSTIEDLLEKVEEYGDQIQMDGFDIDYGNQVLTLKLGEVGTYVLNKQTPNRQIWLSSPVSGPARFDWDQNAQAWIYRRNGSNLIKLLEEELEQLCGEPINLS